MWRPAAVPLPKRTIVTLGCFPKADSQLASTLSASPDPQPVPINVITTPVMQLGAAPSLTEEEQLREAIEHEEASVRSVMASWYLSASPAARAPSTSVAPSRQLSSSAKDNGSPTLMKRHCSEVARAGARSLLGGAGLLRQCESDTLRRAHEKAAHLLEDKRVRQFALELAANDRSAGIMAGLVASTLQGWESGASLSHWRTQVNRLRELYEALTALSVCDSGAVASFAHRLDVAAEVLGDAASDGSEQVRHAVSGTAKLRALFPKVVSLEPLGAKDALGRYDQDTQLLHAAIARWVTQLLMLGTTLPPWAQDQLRVVSSWVCHVATVDTVTLWATALQSEACVTWVAALTLIMFTGLKAEATHGSCSAESGGWIGLLGSASVAFHGALLGGPARAAWRRAGVTLRNASFLFSQLVALAMKGSSCTCRLLGENTPRCAARRASAVARAAEALLLATSFASRIADIFDSDLLSMGHYLDNALRLGVLAPEAVNPSTMEALRSSARWEHRLQAAGAAACC